MDLLFMIMDVASVILSVITIAVVLMTWKYTPEAIEEAEDATYA